MIKRTPSQRLETGFLTQIYDKGIAKYKSSNRSTERKVSVGAQCLRPNWAQALRPYIDGATPLIRHYERTFWRFYCLEFPYIQSPTFILD